MAINNEIAIDFTNDGGAGETDKNVYFWTTLSRTIEGPTDLWNSWNCGLTDQDYRCNKVGYGLFKWGGEYTIKFGKFISRLYSDH